MNIKELMKEEIAECEKALEDGECTKKELNEELIQYLFKLMDQEKFSLVHKQTGSVYNGINGDANNRSIKEIWDIVRRVNNQKEYEILYQTEKIPAPIIEDDYLTFSQFRVYVANHLMIPYSL